MLARSNFKFRFVASSRAVVVLFLLALTGTGTARDLIGNAATTSSSRNSSSSSSATSQTATAATTAAAQAAQAAVVTRRAQDSLVRSTAAFQSALQAQMAAQSAAQANAANNLFDSSQSPINGLAVGGLNPAGGLPAAKSSPSVEVVDLGAGGKGQLVLSNGGSVTLPGGTSGSDSITISGAGTVTTTSGNVTVTAGSLSTTTGGTLAVTNGGNISLTAGSGTLEAATSATITSTLAGTITLPSGGATLSIAANQAITVPAGSSIKFTGTGTASVAVSGAGTLTLAGAGTLSLANAAAGTGGTINTSSGTTSFTNGTISSQAPGSTISLSGSGTINFAGSGSDFLPVILQPAANAAPPAFATTGTLLPTTGYVLPTSWIGIDALSQSVNGTNGQTTVTITQDLPESLLNWQTFNVGKNTILDFDQSAGGAAVGDWISINRILDPSLAPSQILGAIEAPGQVYVINQNGIVFTGSAQVDTHALVASTLPINENLVANGLLNNPEGQFLFTSLAIPSVQGSTPYDPNSDPNALPDVASGNISVGKGASLFSPGSPEGVGGKIALLAPSVDNEGDLSSPDGQIILAAGQQVGFVAHPSADPSLRGLDVAIGAGDGTVTNGASGFIYAPEADVTMTGLTVNQLGIIESETSVALNGRIDLLAVDNLAPDPQNSYIFDSAQGDSSVGGTVNLGPNSLTEVLPDYSSTATEVGTSLALPSQVYVAGQTFHMESGAQLIAPNATATLSVGILNTTIAPAAGETSTPLPENTGASALNGQQIASADYLSSPGEVTLDSGANLDVSGSSGVQASVTENIVSAQLTEAVLENSPLQETGPLRDQTVQVDISLTGKNPDGSTYYGSPIGDLSGYANLVEHTVGELTVSGGSVAINTNGAVLVNANSTVNVSGGTINYQGAMVQTSTVIAADGQILNISQATPNQAYKGIDNGFTVSSAKYGLSQTYPDSLETGSYFDASYVEGGKGGTLTIDSPSATLNGSLFGNTTVGGRQQAAPPAPSTFTLDIQSATGGNPPAVDVFIQPTDDAQSADPNTLYLSTDLFGVDGFGNSNINSGSGLITVASDAVISASVAGSVNLTGANVNIEGEIYVPSGTLTVTGLAKDPIDAAEGNPTPYDPTIGNVEIGSGALIATTGLTFDETSDIAPGSLPFSENGGAVSISGAVTTLETGSVVDASGGATRNAAGKILSGVGGTIALTGLFNGSEGNADGSLVLNGSLSAYGIGQGGSLKLRAPDVEVGSGTAQIPVNTTPLFLSPGFFSQGGFSNFSVIGSAGVQILPGTLIAPVLTEEVANGSGQRLAVDLVSSSQLPPYPAAPVNLAFSAPGASGDQIATLTLGSGGSIITGPTGAVSLTGQLVDILGDVTAPGGSIAVKGDSTGALVGQITFGQPDTTVYLGPSATLSVQGTEITTPTPIDSHIYNIGKVLNGGSINITGNIVGDSGASLIADGTVGTLDVPVDDTSLDLASSAFPRSTNPYVRETLGSNGGSITLDGLEELYFGGRLSAKAGNGTAIGGTLTVTSGISETGSTPPAAGYPEIYLSQDNAYAPGTVTLGSPLAVLPATGGGYFTVNQFNNGQFGSLILNGNVDFQTSVTINASQQVQIVPDSLNGTIFADPSASNLAINISAPYIAIGATSLNFSGQSVSDFAPSYVSITTNDNVLPASPVPGLVAPTYGTSTISLNATDLIDVGFLSLQNIGTTNFSVPAGDLRGGGLLYASGTINLKAGQIYTPTAATFTVAAFDAGPSLPGTVNILPDPGVSRPLPLSAGGTINIYATDIDQEGVLEAPFGTINLGALPDLSTGLTPVLGDAQFTFDSSNQTYVTVPVYDENALVTQQLTLGSSSITSVSGVSSDGQALDLPYGTISNGTDWIAPNGADITAGGLPAKAINIEGANVRDAAGSLVDLAGGGDLFAYQFSPGVNGTNDILSIDKYANGAVVTNSSGVALPSNSFAIEPNYNINYAPVDLTIDSNGNLPYANSSLTGQIGNQIYLAGGDGLPAGTYTILPARYALLPGAFLVTPTANATPRQSALNPDGSVEEAGYLYNSLNPNQQIVPQVTSFEVDSAAVVKSRAEYDISSANTFLKASAIANNQPVPRLPMDAGELVFNATSSLDIQGSLAGQAGTGGLGSTVVIGSPDDIYIVSSSGDAPTLTVPNGVSPSDYSYLTLAADELDKFGADSLLIGGLRSSSSTGTSIDPTTNAIYVENDSASPLTGNEVILASKQTLTLESGASIQQSGVVSSDEQNLTIGDTSLLGSGDGTLIRVTGDPNAQFSRLGVDTSDTSANLVVGAGASISGVAVTIDSSSGAFIDPTAELDHGVAGKALVLSSGAISLQIDPSVSLSSAPGLVIESATLQTLESSVERLSLSSYSTINLFGAGTLGALDSKGQPVVQDLSLQGAGIFGYDALGGAVTINAQNVSINNSGGQSLPGLAPSLSAGSDFNVNADAINFGAGSFAIDGYSTTGLTAGNDMLVSGAGVLDVQGSLNLATPLLTSSAGANFAFSAQAGSLSLAKPAAAATATVASGLGGTISLDGSSVILGSNVSTPSGTINVQASAGNVEVQSGGALDVSGRSVTFGNVTDYTSGGQVNLISSSGNVVVDSGGLVNLSAPTGGGNAGTLMVSAANGNLSLASGSLKAAGGSNGVGGSFSAHLGQITTLSDLTTPLTASGFQSIAFDVLTGSVTVDGAVGAGIGQDGLASFSLSAEQGGITVENSINASGTIGGTIDLYANQDVTLTGNAQLSVAGQQFNNAGQGGFVDLETRGAGTQGIDIQSGAKIDLSVAYLPVLLPETAGAQAGTSITLSQAGSFVLPKGTPGNDQLQLSSGGTVTTAAGVSTTFAANQLLTGLTAGSTITLSSPATVTFVAGGSGGTVPIWLSSTADFTSAGATNASGSAALTATAAGDSAGILHLRAPTTSNGTDLKIASTSLANADIVGGSGVVLEGYNVYNTALTTTAGQSTGQGQIDAGLEGSPADAAPGTIYGGAQIFAGNTANILKRLLGLSSSPTATEEGFYQVTPGAEITNPSSSANGGDLTLASDWDLSSFRFGPNNVAGLLTLRAVNNLVFTGSLTDGFSYNPNDDENVQGSPYTWDVISGPSWSYRLVAGARFTASGASTAGYGSVQSLVALGLDDNSLTNSALEAGSLLLGQNIPAGTNFGLTTAQTASTYAQLIRTGTGSITIEAGGSVDLLSQLATIYTSGSLSSTLPGFDSPTGTSDSKYETKVYGRNIAPAPQYTAQYTQGGGNISIDAQQDIAHLTQDENGDLVLDTSWQFPTNWLYRRGATSSTDVFDTTKLNANEDATTTWWIDFSNFFEGIGALGGGNVSLQAGGNIVNVDAAVPTNARLPYANAAGTPLADSTSNLVELGGGNLTVSAGGAIEGGTYYVEQGTGLISAGTITSADDTARISAQDISLGQDTPLPLTLFVGNSSFTVNATDDLTLGSTVNPFWLPQGIGNNFNNESIFTTYAAGSGVSLSSLLGNINIQGAEFAGSALPGSLYNAYLSNASPGGLKPNTSSEQSLNGTPWTLTLDPTSVHTSFIDNVTDYSTFYELSPPIFNATAFSSNIQYDSDQLLMPSAQGTLRLLAAGSIDGAFNDAAIGNGLTASITILDDDPSQLPSVVNPSGLGHSTTDPANNPSINSYIGQAFALVGEAPSYENESFPTLESYHTPGLLHDNSSTPPVEIDTTSGDIGDFTLISPEKANISSGLDLQDVSFYIQNNNANDISTVTANRDITLYDPTSAALVDLGAANSYYVAFGDLQISGPGTLEVLAGRNLNLGEGVPPNSLSDPGTGLGITSIGQSRDPYLPFGGAQVIAAAGIGDTSGLSSNPQLLNFQAFETAFLNDPAGVESARYLPDLGNLLGLTNATGSQILNIYNGTPDASLTAQELQIQASLTPEDRDALATTLFYDVLRDAGRDHNDPTSPDAGTYTEAYAAIAALFPSGDAYQGDISLTSREIKTTNGGDIDLLAPGGGIDVGLNNLGTQAVDQGILTVDGGNISIFTNNDVSIGTSRIFTLHGGNVIIFSTTGNIDAGASSKTVQSAPPTRVLVDSQSANVQTDLAGLATGGGIGVLETVIGAPPGNVDLIAPVGTVNAGDAGIRSSGNINVAAAQVLNAGNIQAGGSSTGVPTTSVPNISATVAASSAGASTQNAEAQTARQQQPDQTQQIDLPSIISVEVLGYGGGDDSADNSKPSDTHRSREVADGR